MLVLPFIRYFMTRSIRQRVLVHRGTTVECAMDLQDYGIPKSNLPKSMGGDYEPNDFSTWLQKRQQLELEEEEELFASVDDLDLELPMDADGEAGFLLPPDLDGGQVDEAQYF